MSISLNWGFFTTAYISRLSTPDMSTATCTSPLSTKMERGSKEIVANLGF